MMCNLVKKSPMVDDMDNEHKILLIHWGASIKPGASIAL
jgi:hypothetical protein